VVLPWCCRWRLWLLTIPYITGCHSAPEEERGGPSCLLTVPPIPPEFFKDKAKPRLRRITLLAKVASWSSRGGTAFFFLFYSKMLYQTHRLLSFDRETTHRNSKYKVNTVDIEDLFVYVYLCETTLPTIVSLLRNYVSLYKNRNIKF
jgi:hypothetical protein